MPLAIDISARTHRGLVRESNQDAVLVLEKPDTPNGIQALAAVADGMGGLPAGYVASRLAIDALRKQLAQATGGEPVMAQLGIAIETANRAVCDDSRDTPGHRGMGTTLTVAVVAHNQLLIVHVGDSRAYLLRSGQLGQLTVDHTWVQEGLDAGILTQDEALVHPYRHMLTRALGLDPLIDCQFDNVPLHSGDVVLVCTDGLHGEVDETRISSVLARGSASESAEALEELALAAGGADNVTTAVIKLS